MLFWRIPIFCTFLVVRGSSQSSLDFNFGSLIHSSFHSEGGKEQENAQRLLHRPKRQAVTHGITPVEYIIDIDISFAESSLQEAIKSYFDNFSFPLLVSSSTANISSINVTTVCNSTGNNTRCYCEPGYQWPAQVYHVSLACPNTTAPEASCNCIAQLPPQGTYCQLQDGGGPLIHIIKMSVCLNKTFQRDLSDSSSMLYKKYKHDLEKAFNNGYRCLPGFRYATVTGFRPGSVIVKFAVNAARSIPVLSASTKVAEALSPTYSLITSSFTRHSEVIKGNMSVSPDSIFEGDTITIRCELNQVSNNVSWYLAEHLVSSSSRHSITSGVLDGTSTSTLKIASITLNETGNYSCMFTKQANSVPLIYQDDKSITVSPIKIVPSEDVEIACDGKPKELSCCTDGEISWFHSSWNPNGSINISGTIKNTQNCTKYQLEADVSQCPAEKSGSTTDYTCELSTADGARKHSVIRVTYCRVANISILSSTPGKVSEGDHFSVSCKSDVSNYDKVTWQIQTGNFITDVSSIWYTTTQTRAEAESVLTVGSATLDWTGTYICTFFQKCVNSSARKAIEVFPLPRKQDIIRYPIEAFIPCPGTQVLKCCSSKNENYTVTFHVPQRHPPDLAGIREKGRPNCYSTTMDTGDRCNPADPVFRVVCKFTNQIGGSVQSLPMILNLVPVKNVMCNSSQLGVGKNGAVITKSCLYSNETSNSVRGNLTYRCDHTQWVLAGNSCLSFPVNNLLSSAESLASSPESVQKLPTYLQNLSVTVKQEQQTINTSAANLRAVVEILHLISVIPVAAEQNTMENFLSTVDTIISSPTETWNAVKNGSSQLLDSVEQFSASLQPINNTIPPITYDNLQLKGVVINGSSVSGYNKSFVFSRLSNLSGSVLIERAKIETQKLNSTIISVAYATLGHIIPQYNNTDGFIVNGLVLSTTLSASSQLGKDFHVNMTFTKTDRSLKNPRCVFWNFSFSGGRGGWDETGCESQDNGNSVTCYCNHLTSFSILMSPSDERSDALSWLDYISYIGLSISVLSLLACTVIEAVVWKSVTKTRISYMRHICILNIAVCLLIADIWFIVIAAMHDEDEPMNLHMCTAVTFFIHFFYLCVFFWMLTLGFMLFYHLIFIFHNTSKTIMKAVGFFLGYGCPLAISVITIAMTYPQNSYTRDNICLLNWKKSKALLALIIPAMVMVAINAIVTIVVIAKIPRRSIGEKSLNDEKSSLYRIAKSIGVLTPLLGLTWGFGLATVLPDSPEVFHVLFTIFNAFQGLFILLCGILWDRKVRETLMNKCSLSRWTSQLTKSTSQGMSAPMLSISSPFSRTLNNLFGKTGKYQVSSTESASSSSENTSKAYSLLT
ncbi:adhesion G protein-coupled receptor F5 [Tiliqua scincoides]|uniref:adhesion G protein-coupled receptor F5 n=1 Tax=Tiliqua scincoides TaxID=71010 RepID=UPI003463501C